ncbi:hypothetical protein HJG60_009250 [Phyllostomus discolor]|uniref:Uncharacterized protein n=1 Tax=Phyllostomus discolor TaxID=89673 RepID=A0A833YQ52_9CHIR|nr:hypothetical protein HJG60_009250 [Phyllostomus discolor]
MAQHIVNLSKTLCVLEKNAYCHCLSSELNSWILSSYFLFLLFSSFYFLWVAFFILFLISFFLRFYLFIFREGREGDRERERERNVSVRLLRVMACNPGTYPGWESNLGHFGSQPALNPLSYASQGLFLIS